MLKEINASVGVPLYFPMEVQTGEIKAIVGDER